MRSSLRGAQKSQHVRRLTAIAAVVSLLGGALAVGAGMQAATADPWAPAVTAKSVDPSGAGKDFVLAGEQVGFDVNVANRSGGPQFNLSLVTIVPASVSFVSGGAFGTPTIFPEGTVLPNRSRATADDCVALGLVAAGASQPTLCAVPAGQQVWVWSNVNDLPQGGAVSSTITVAPVDDLYPVGSEVAFSVRAYTSTDPSRLPTFDGSPSVSRTTDHTSGVGSVTDTVPVRALRVVKDEPSPEGQLLRGVHDDTTTYTLRVKNTARGVTRGAVVTDYLPAGLEYLGLGTTDNGTSGEEYPTSGAVSGGAVSAETVDTVQLSASETAVLGLAGPGVYTKVTWALGDLAADASVELRYRAAVPLFANTLWADGSAPSPESGGQAANLDNNLGASTRQGGATEPEPGQSLRNVASVTGTYQGPVLGGDDSLRAAADRDTEAVEAVDVRVVKSVDAGALFTTGGIATFSVRLDVSEYVDAHDVVLTDVIPNGLCPAFPGPFDDDVVLTIGGSVVDRAAWNAAIPGEACSLPTQATGAQLSSDLHVASIAYDPTAGTFTVVFDVDDLTAGESFEAKYSVMARPNYTGAGGGTSSGDSFVNRVTVTAATEPIAAIADDPQLRDRVGGTRHVTDESAAMMTSRLPAPDKTVLERGQTPTDPGAQWVKESSQPFSPGDDVWYRVTVPFARGIDTRNPIVTDYLPEGIELTDVQYGFSGFPGFTDVTGPVAYGSGTFPSAYIPDAAPGGPSLTWAFGSRDRTSSTDRFVPSGSTVTLYLHGTVQSQSTSRDDVDSPLNHAKYQQVNVDGELFFHRSSAGIDLDWGATLTKGIRSVNGTIVGSRFGDRLPTRQVVQGDDVEYRIDVTAPQNTTTDYLVWDVLPAGVTKADVSGYTADVYDSRATTNYSAIAGSQVDMAAYDAGDALPQGIALSAAYAGRSVIAWTVRASVPGSTPASENVEAATRGLSLGYTLTVPSGIAGGGAPAQLTQSYTNTAGIVSYGIENTASRTTTIVPQRADGGQQLTTRTPQTGEVEVSDVDTVDTAEVHLPDLSLTKNLISTEVGPVDGTPPGTNDLGDGDRNTGAEIVQGEQATFEYAVTVPARTTVKGAVLSDGGALALSSGGSIRYHYVVGSAVYLGPDGEPLTTGTDTDDFRTADSDGTAVGVLTFPDTYTNATGEPETFRVRITAWVDDRDDAPANSGKRQIDHGTVLTNTATLTFSDPNGAPGTRVPHTATARAEFIEPSPAVTKTSSTAQVAANGTVTYTITASNESGRPALFDSVVIDCVPSEIVASDLTPSTGTATILAESCGIGAGGAIERGSGTGQLIEWKIGTISGTGSAGAATLTYTGRVDTQAGGGSSFTNRAELRGYTLPLAVGSDADTSARRGMLTRGADRTVKMPDASILKTVSPGSSAVGGLVTYTLTTTLPASTNFYDVALTDTLPAGVEFIPGGTHTETANWAGAPAAPAIGAPVLSGRTLSWSISSDDIAAWTAPRTITVTFQARLTPGVVSAAPTNTGTFAWTAVDGSTTPADRKTTSSPRNVTILNPSVTIAKAVKATGAADTAYVPSATGEPDQSFTYRVRVTNATGTGTAPAHNVVVTDTVDAGVRIDTTQSVFAGAAFSDETALRQGRGGRITWTLAGPLSNIAGSNTVDLVYRGTFVAAGDLRPVALRNAVAVTQYESASSEGWLYRPGVDRRPGGATIPTTNTTGAATVTPRFPQVAFDKRVTSGSEAFVGESFSWTLEARNTGTGAAKTITLTDTLPANWQYDETVTPRITIGTGAAVDLGAPQIETRNGHQTLTWTVAPAGGVALPGTATAAALAQRTLLITFSATPLADAVTDAGAGLSIDHRNTVTGSATDTTDSTANAAGAYAGAEASAVAHIARADLVLVKTAVGGDAKGAWTAGDTARSGYTQPQWRITITNRGPDAASGPFLVTDETEQPAGVTTGAFTARYYSSATDAVGTSLSLTGSGTASDPFVVGGRTGTLKADGSDRIVLVADVSIQAPATGTPKNTASVTGRTYERPDDIAKDNGSSASKQISSAADLALTKSVNTAEPTAGRPISWSINVVNNGPSVSASTSAQPITVTDTVPAGISGVQAPLADVTSWTATASNGWPAAAGDTVTWTFTGTQLAVGSAQALSLTGVVDASWTGGAIRNTASVAPGATEDPNPANDEGSVSVTPGDDTTLAIAKTRVVFEDGEWKDAAERGEALPAVVAGESASYRVTVTNNGPADAREVTVVDEVPSMLGSPTVRNETGIWTRTAGPGSNDTFALSGTLPVAAGDNTRSFIVTYAVDPSLAPGSEVENWASARAVNATNEPRARDTDASDRIVDLSIAKQAIDGDGAPMTDAEATAGTQLRFRLTVTNNGPSFSGGPIEVTDRLPAGMSYVSSTLSVAGGQAVSASPAVSDDGRSLAWTAVADDATLASGQTIVIEVTVAVAADVRPQQLVNAADVSGPDDSDPRNNHAEAVVDIVTDSTMSIVKSVEEGPWVAGTRVTYTLTVTNNGPSVADAVVKDELPVGLVPVSIAGEGWTCDDEAQICTRSGHPVGESTITVVALVAAGVPAETELTNTATLTWTDSRTTSAHTDTDDATIAVSTQADLHLSKTAVDADGAEISAAVVGETVRYRIEAENRGPSDAVGPVTVVDTLPQGMSFQRLVGESAQAWSAEVVDERTVVFTLLPEGTGLANGASVPTIELEVLIDSDVAHGTVLTNSAVVESGTPDPTPSDNEDSAELTVAREVDLSVSKTHDADAVRIGDELPFAIEVRNSGPSEATDVVITDVVPAGLEVLTAPGDEVGEDWTVESVEPVDPEDSASGVRVVARYAPSLAPGEVSSVLTIATRVEVAAYPGVVNVVDAGAAEITEEHPDRTPADNRAEDEVVVPPMSALVVTKSAVGAFQVGKTGEYRIVVRNDGPTADPGPLTVSDALPAGLTFAGSPDEGVRADGRLVTWTLADGLAVGEEVTLTLRVNVGQSAYPSVTNVVTVDSPTEQTDDAVLVADATASVKAADPLATTGGEVAGGLIAMALLLLLAGGLFAAYRRRDSTA